MFFFVGSLNIFRNATARNLRLLTIDHVLGDIAHLVTKVLQDYDTPDARVVIFGSRLAGTISALARKKFPHLIHGVWTSGGLFRAMLPEVCKLKKTTGQSVEF